MRGDRGSAAVISVALLAVAVAAGVVLAAVVGLASDRAAARSAADLAALAGAHAVRDDLADQGTGREPCEIAARTAVANSATLTVCRVYGDGSVQVTVASGSAIAQARAGPAGPRNEEGPGGDSG